MSDLTHNNQETNRFRIHSHVTRASFLHIEEAVALGKVRLFAGLYRRGQGSHSLTHHFLDIADARVVFTALTKPEPGYVYQEYKGSGREPVESRVLRIKCRDDRTFIELKRGPGKRTATGAVSPAGPATVNVTVACSTHEVQRLAHSVLAFLQGWDVVRLLEAGLPLPKELVRHVNGL